MSNLQPTLPTLEPTGFVLWFKPEGKRTAWEPVASAATERECLDAIGIGGRRHGGWMILPSGTDPDA